MAKTVLTPGSVVTAAFLNALNNPQFDGLDLDGHRAPITDSELDPGGLIGRVAAQQDALKVTALTPTSVRVAAGAVSLPTGAVQTIATTDFTALQNGSYFVQVNSAGVPVIGTAVLPVSLVLAAVEVNGTTNPTITDYRAPIVPVRPNLTPVFGGTATTNLVVRSAGANETVGDTAYVTGTLSSPALLASTLQVKNLTIEAGAYATAAGYSRVEASGDVTIAGVLTVTPRINGGQGFTGTVRCPSNVYAQPGAGFGGASGHNAGAPATYDYWVSMVGSGGASAFCKASATLTAFSDFTDSISCTIGNGGKGGGGLLIQAAGTVTLSGTITANGEAAQASTYSSGLGANQFLLIGGAGGGSGGRIIVQSATTVNIGLSTVLSANGGAGAVGYVTPAQSASYTCRGGGGGGGGFIMVNAPAVTGFVAASGNFTASGGNAGANTGTGGNTLAGSPGGSCHGAGGIGGATGASGTVLQQVGQPILIR